MSPLITAKNPLIKIKWRLERDLGCMCLGLQYFCGRPVSYYDNLILLFFIAKIPKPVIKALIKPIVPKVFSGITNKGRSGSSVGSVSPVAV